MGLSVMGGRARCLLDDDGRAILPSAVRYTAEGPVVGYAALDDAAGHAATTLTSVKRFMGRSMDEALAASEQMGHWNYGAILGKVGGEPPTKGQKTGEMNIAQAVDYAKEVGAHLAAG